MKKTARFIRILPRGNAWWVVACLVKVTPAIIYDEYVTYRKGKLLKNNKFMPRRLHHDRRTGKEGFDWMKKPDPIYFHSYRTRSTAFIIASAADLGAMMEKSRQDMIKLGESKLAAFATLELDDPAREKGVADAQETIRLFKNQERFEVETYLFPAGKDGKSKSSSELSGSQKGTLDHRKLFEDMGYELVGFPDIEWVAIPPGPRAVKIPAIYDGLPPTFKSTRNGIILESEVEL